MGHSYTSCLYHCVFSTKDRRRMIDNELAEKLWPYIGGIARENGMTALRVGGVEDHIHILLSLPSTIPISKAMQIIKAVSSKWIHETFPHHRNFSWQEGYGAFSIGVSQVETTIEYINNQQKHHEQFSYEGEFVAILKKHGIEYDERYVWG